MLWLRRVSTSAAAGTGAAFAPCGLYALRDLYGVLAIFIGGAPEEQASGNSPDGDRNPQLCSHTEEAAFSSWSGVYPPEL
jgi:hypothetical protein